MAVQDKAVTKKMEVLSDMVAKSAKDVGEKTEFHPIPTPAGGPLELGLNRFGNGDTVTFKWIFIDRALCAQ